jgi:hypothetical protein
MLLAAGALLGWITTSGRLTTIVAAQDKKPGVPAIDTRIGKIDLVHGYPTEASLRKLIDEMDFQRACQIHLWALPAVGFHGLHQAHLNKFAAADGDIVVYGDLKDKAGMLTPNLTTVYIMSFWDLNKQGPLIVEVPSGATAGGVLDIWQRPISDIGQTGPDKGKGGKYLFLPPGAKPGKAEGYIVKQATGVQLWFATRGLSPETKDAEATLRKHRLYGWNQRENPPATKYVPVGGREWTSQQPSDLKYWRYLAEVLAPEPTEPRDGFFLAMLAPLGIEKGKPFNPDARQKRILTDAALVGELMARGGAYEKRFPGAVTWEGTQWKYANMVELNQEAKQYAQLDERATWFYEAIGNSAGMQGRTLNFGQVYLETSKDKSGAWLDGGQHYHLRVPPNPPVKQFWSFTLYDNVTRGPVITDQGAADLSSRQKLAMNGDGSVDLYFGPTRPAGANDNWVKTTAGNGWFPYFRLYGPTEAYFDKSWRLPDIERLK